MEDIQSYKYAHLKRFEMLKYIPNGAQTILDIGCYTGSFGKVLKEKFNIEVWGVEPTPEAAKIANTILDKVIVSEISDDLAIPENYFDVIVFNDVLEHMIDPWESLKYVKKHLKNDGCIVSSIPNMRHISNLIHIVIDGDFNYEPWGIRDKTHLRFFTKKSATKLFNTCGYKVEKVEGINEDWFKKSILRRILLSLFPKQLEETKFIQYAFVAKPINT